MHKWAQTHRYAVTRKSSKPDRYVFFGCNRRGQHVTSSVVISKRERTTQKCGCLFVVSATAPTQKDLPKIWTLKSKFPTHNHDPSASEDVHPVHRRLTTGEFNHVKNLASSGVKTSQILQQVKQLGSQALSQTIYNARSKVVREKLAGLTSIQCMFECIEASDTWNSRFLKKNDGVLVNLFWAHQGSINLARKYHHVALIDVTYRTN